MIVRPRLAAALLALLAGTALAQEAPKLKLPRPSPNATLTQTVGLTDISVAYSSPTVKGRKILGGVVPYDEVWRAGANACTKVTFSGPVTIGGKQVPAGTYALFLLPSKTGWSFILNKNTELWGAVDYKQADDVLRVPATASTIPARERLAYELLDFTDEAGTLALEWDTFRVGVKFELGTRAKLLAEIRALKTDDWQTYNSAARYLLDNRFEPAYAMQLVDRSIKLKEGWLNLWTKAELLRAAGKTQEALALGTRAQALGKKDKDFFYQDEIAQALADWKK